MSSLPINIPGSHPASDQSSDESEELPEGSPVLRDDTAAALRDFLQDREQIQVESRGNPFSENWGLSQVHHGDIAHVRVSSSTRDDIIILIGISCVQFWYTHETAAKVAQAVAANVGTLGRVACIACPSLFHELLQSYPQVKCDLFEFDTRFQVSVVCSRSVQPYRHVVNLG
jgi:EEF1A lysine methyltransferase 1